MCGRTYTDSSNKNSIWWSNMCNSCKHDYEAVEDALGATWGPSSGDNRKGMTKGRPAGNRAALFCAHQRYWLNSTRSWLGPRRMKNFTPFCQKGRNSTPLLTIW